MWLVRKEKDGATIDRFAADTIDSAQRQVTAWAKCRVPMSGGVMFQYGKSTTHLYTILNITDSVLRPALDKSPI